MFDYHVLDMVELGLEKFVSLQDVKVCFRALANVYFGWALFCVVTCDLYFLPDVLIT